MQIHSIKRTHPNRKERRVGRGGVHGKTSGRGTKGQNSRAGHRKRPEIRDIIKKLPKKRGYGKNRAVSVVLPNILPVAVNVGLIDRVCDAGAITHAVLIEKGLVKTQKGKLPVIKVLATGEVTKKFALTGVKVSAAAKAKIEKAGGSVA